MVAAFGLDSRLGGFFGRVLGLACGVVGGLLVPRFFDLFVIGASAISGAAMLMTGANHIDRATGGVLPALLTIVLAVAGVIWQRSNIVKLAKD